MKNLPAILFLLILSVFPFFSYAVRTGTGSDPNYFFGFITILLLCQCLYRVYATGNSLRVPYYLMIFGLFTAYTLLSGILVSDKVITTGVVKYFYSDPFIQTFVAFLYIENTYFPPKWINKSVKILGGMLVIAAVVSIIQISDPLFLVDTSFLKEGLSPDRLAEYYAQNPKEVNNSVSRFLIGYRLSIYSYISDLAVGIDSLAVFSLLFALRPVSRARKGILLISAGLISFLSSARWVMLNFLIVAGQNLFVQKNKILNALKYLFLAMILIAALVTTASLVGIDVQRFVEKRLFDDSAGTRLLAFEVFFKVFPDHPIFGTGGVDTPKMLKLIGDRTSQIHVGYLKLFYYYGLVGGLILLAFLGTLLAQLWKKARQTKYWGSFFAFLAFAFANLTLVEWSLFYHGLLLALIFSNHFVNEGNPEAVVPDAMHHQNNRKFSPPDTDPEVLQVAENQH